MEILIGIVVGLLVLTWVIQRVNSRYDEKRESKGPTADLRVAQAWDDFGSTDDTAVAQARFEKLIAKAPVPKLKAKDSLARMGLMAIRAERFDVLPDIATRAARVDAECGETTALVALAEAYQGDPEQARKLLEKARFALAGCASCATDVDGQLLLREAAIAFDALSSGEGNLANRGGGPTPEMADPPSEGMRYRQLAERHRTDAAKARDGDAEIAAADVALARAEEWVTREPASADASVAKGVALWRLGPSAEAQRAFEKAVEIDEDCWPAYVALTALHEKSPVAARVKELGQEALANKHVAEVLNDLVDGFAALTERERAMLAVAALELGELLDSLADGGARVRVVPIHLRARDLGLSARGLGETVYCDGQHFDAEGAYVSSRRAVLRWDALCRVSWPLRAIAMMAAQYASEATRRAMAHEATPGDPAGLARPFAEDFVGKLAEKLGLVRAVVHEAEDKKPEEAEEEVAAAGE